MSSVPAWAHAPSADPVSTASGVGPLGPHVSPGHLIEERRRQSASVVGLQAGTVWTGVVRPQLPARLLSRDNATKKDAVLCPGRPCVPPARSCCGEGNSAHGLQKTPDLSTMSIAFA